MTTTQTSRPTNRYTKPSTRSSVESKQRQSKGLSNPKDRSTDAPTSRRTTADALTNAKASAVNTIREAVKEAATRGIADPRVIAADVFPQISPADYAALVREWLPGHVADIQNASRNNNRAASRESVAPVNVEPKWRAQVRLEAWQRRLGDVVRVPQEDGQWVSKVVAQMTSADCYALAEYHDGKSDAHKAIAREARSWGHAIEDKNVETFEQLPSFIKAELL